MVTSAWCSELRWRSPLSSHPWTVLSIVGRGLAATLFGEQMVFGEGTKPMLGSYFLLAVWCDLIYVAAFLLGIAN